MRFSHLLIGVLVISVALAVSIEDLIPVPAYNVTVKFLDVHGIERELYLPVVPETYRLIQASKILSISYDNSTWINVTRIEQEDWNVIAEGVTEDATICNKALSTGRYKDFLSDPDHCYTRVFAYLDGEQVASTYADDHGNWQLRFKVSPGEHTIEFIAKDPANNQAVIGKSLTWTPSTDELFFYYLSIPYVEVGIGLGVLVLVLIIWKVVSGRIAKAKKGKKTKMKLDQLFQEEAHLINEYGVNAFETREYRLKIREILLHEPFSTRLEEEMAKFVSLLKSDPQKALDFIRREEVKRRWFDLIKLDTNIKLSKDTARMIAFAYVEIIREFMLDYASKELGLSKHEIVMRMKGAGDI